MKLIIGSIFLGLLGVALALGAMLMLICLIGLIVIGYFKAWKWMKEEWKNRNEG